MIDYNNFINKKISTVKPSGIRKFFDIANEMDDVISLSIGEPDFQTPWHIREEGINSLKKVRLGIPRTEALPNFVKKLQLTTKEDSVLSMMPKSRRLLLSAAAKQLTLFSGHCLILVMRLSFPNLHLFVTNRLR